MQFKQKTIKKYSSLYDLDLKFDVDKELYISNLEGGIPCLIVNGCICNSNGVPFKNTQFQEEFYSISKLFKDCKLIGIGILVDANNPKLMNYNKIVNIIHSKVESINYKNNSIGLILYNGVSQVATNMPYKTIYGMISGMIKSSKLKYGKIEQNNAHVAPIEIEKISSKEKDKIIDIIISNSKKAESTIIIDPESPYGVNDEFDYSRQMVMFNLNTIESYEIISFEKTNVSQHMESIVENKKKVRSIRVKTKSGESVIEVNSENELTLSLLLDLMEKNKIKNINLYGFIHNKVSYLNLLI